MKKGFTLIEVLIVIFIIGLLASVVLIGLGSFRARGRDARRAADLRSIQHALELYYGKSGSYPVLNWAGLKTELVSADIGVTVVPDDPASGQSYQYGSNSQSYVLGAKLEDKNNQLLRDDFDGGPGSDTFEVNCGDPANDEYYCIKF